MKKDKDDIVTEVSYKDIADYGLEVWGEGDNDIKRFVRWLTTPNKAFGGKKPTELTSTPEGKLQVYNAIKDGSGTQINCRDIVDYGIDVWGKNCEGAEKFVRWLSTPNRAMDSKAPVDLMDTPEGRLQVYNEIGRAEWGLFS